MESTWWKPTVVGNRKTSLCVPGEVKTNETDQSHPISAACQSAWRIAARGATWHSHRIQLLDTCVSFMTATVVSS
jgi:hypothetical protein